MLICKFASPRSHPAKIATWINYLEDMRRRQGADSEARHVVESLLAQARTWLRDPAHG